jgi:hypothetical protein
MQIKCRAKRSPNCYEGRECVSVYGGYDSMDDDGTFDGETVICDACYIAIGQPALPVEEVTSRQQVIDHVNRALEEDR